MQSTHSNVNTLTALTSHRPSAGRVASHCGLRWTDIGMSGCERIRCTNCHRSEVADLQANSRSRTRVNPPIRVPCSPSPSLAPLPRFCCRPSARDRANVHAARADRFCCCLVFSPPPIPSFSSPPFSFCNSQERKSRITFDTRITRTRAHTHAHARTTCIGHTEKSRPRAAACRRSRFASIATSGNEISTRRNERRSEPIARSQRRSPRHNWTPMGGGTGLNDEERSNGRGRIVRVGVGRAG